MGVGGGAEGFEPRRTRASSSSSSSSSGGVIAEGEASLSESASSHESARGAGAGLRAFEGGEEEVVMEREERVAFRSVVGGLAGCVVWRMGGEGKGGIADLWGFVKT